MPLNIADPTKAFQFLDEPKSFLNRLEDTRRIGEVANLRNRQAAGIDQNLKNDREARDKKTLMDQELLAAGSDVRKMIPIYRKYGDHETELSLIKYAKGRSDKDIAADIAEGERRKKDAFAQASGGNFQGARLTVGNTSSQYPDNESFMKYLGASTGATPATRKTIKGADGFNYFEDTGERVLPGVQAKPDKPEERRIVKGPDDRNYYADTQEPVLPDVKAKPEEEAGSRVNAQLPDGSIVPAIENKSGQLVSTTTGERLPDAIKAPSRNITGPPGSFGTSSQQGQDKRELDFLSRQRSNLREMIVAVKQQPSLVGLPGAFRQAGQTVTGMVQDITSIIGDNKVNDAITDAQEQINGGGYNLTAQEKFEFFNDPNLSRLRLFENSLGLALARLRHPSGRVPVEVIKRSINDAKLTGITSSKDVINRLEQIDREMGRNQSDIEKRLGIGGNDKASLEEKIDAGTATREDKLRYLEL